MEGDVLQTTQTPDAGPEPIAIVGIGCRFPGNVDDPRSYWDLLVNGVDAVTEIPRDRLDLLTYHSPDHATPGTFISRSGGFVRHIDQFSPEFFAISPREAASMDPQQRLMLEVAWRALEDAGQIPQALAGTDTGVFIGISTHDFSDIKFSSSNRRLIDAHTATGGALSIAANRISYVLDLRGPSMAVDTACSSSLVAVHQACQAIRHRECSVAIAGGVNLLLCAEPFIGFSKASMLSPDGRCKAFDEQANGYVRAEGAGAVVLKPLSRAVADGDDVYCVIIGSAVNQDGRSKGLTVPSRASQEALIETACAAAGIEPIDIQYVEAHGTGTPVGDPIEANAVGRVLSRNRPADRPCLIGSAKTNLGHLEAASGMAGLIKAALSLQRRTIPASLHFRRANPDIDLQQLGLQVPTRTQRWPAAPDERAIASVNSFGFGGTNAHVIAAEAPAPPAAGPDGGADVERPHILPISARGEKELQALVASYVERLAETAGESPAAMRDFCYTAAVRLSHHGHRLALVAETGDEAIEALNQFLADDPSRSLWSGRVGLHERPKLAFVFSGMGPQWYAMGRELLACEPVFRSVIEECDALLRRYVDWSLLDEMLADEARSRMEDADVAQPANFALQTALAALFRSWGVEPHAIIGHSAGEVAAIHVAGAMTLEQAIHVIVHRSRLQHRTAGQGHMVAVHLPPADAQRLADEFMGDVTVAAINGPSDVTLSVTGGARERLVQTCEQRGIYCRVLRGRVPYHSPMMDPIRHELLDALAPIRPRPTVVPFISTVTGQSIAGESLDAGYWWHNVRHPVRFTSAVDGLLELGCNIFLEIGPHPTLGGFVSACLAHRGRDGVVMPSLRRHEKEQADLMGAIARLYTSGYPIDWRTLYPSGRHVRLPGYPWQRDTHWRESDESLQERVNGTHHVLLGRRLGLAVPAWENHLDLTRLPYLRDHHVQDAIVMPAAAFVEMGLAAGGAVVPASPFVLEEMEFRKALFFTDGATPKVQLVCRPDGVGFDIFSNTSSAENAWVLHASGRLLPATDDRANGATAFARARQRCSEEVSARDCYDALRKMGLQYGPGFQGIERLWRGHGEAFARLRTPDDGEVGENAYRLHPALLDACFQVLIGAVGTASAAESNGGGVYLPVLIKQLRVHRRPAGPLYCTARIRKRTAKFLSGDICLWSAAGDLLVKIAGFRCQRLAALQAARAEDPVTESLYHFKWVAKDHARKSDVPLDLLTPTEIVERLRTAPPVLTDREEETVVQVQQQLDGLAGAYIRTAFRKLGFPSGGAFSEADLATTVGVVPALRPFFGRYLSLLEAEGLVQREGDLWKVGPAPLAADVSPLIERLRSTSSDVPELGLLERCGGHLAEVLQGRANPVELLFPGGSHDEAERVYRSSTAFRVYNLLIGDAVRMAVGRLPSDSAITVLEIGAGTGGTTAHVLPALPADRTRYVFSDLSARFLQIADDKFRDRPGFETRLLDIERDPEEQGFERQGFDVVIAADVLHTTRDLESTLEHVKRLLAPQGLFVLLEVTSAPRWVDLVFGITEGWFRFTDASLRGSYPLLSRERWVSVLSEAGFPDVGTIVHDFEGLGSTQSVLVAQAPAAVPTASRVLPDVDATGNWIILADSGDLSSGIAERIASGGGRPTVIHANAEGRHGRHGRDFTTDPAQPERMVSLLEEVFESLDDCRAIVHMWSVAAPPLEDVASLERAQALGSNSLVSILNVVLARSWPSGPEFHVVTRGAQPADGQVACAAQAPVIGIGRVMRNEVPALKTRMVDLDPVRRDDEVETLWRELWTDDGEEEIALRGGARIISRFSRLNLDEILREQSRPAGDEAPPFRLEVVTPGALDTLSLKATERRPPGPDEVEVRVHAAGLNFRDVMLGMGLLVDAVQEGSYFGDALGMECAGTITAVGDQVRNVAVGDEVIAQGRGCFAAYMTTQADYVVRKPGHLTFEEAATIPVAFVTAYYALNRLSQLARGERILIHAAAGGVGLVAVMLAQKAGAEIFATAGSEQKRDFLRSLGVTHVMNSRTLAFADEIMEATDGNGVDVVLNSLSGEAIGKSMSILGPQGRFVEIGKTDIAQGKNLNLAPFANSLSYFAVDIDRILHARPTYAAALFQEAMAYFEREGLRPVHSTAYPLSDIATAFRDMAQARHIGKIVVSMDDDAAWITRTDTARTFVRSDATYLITGGLGGFGLTVAKWLVGAGATHLVLMGRTAPVADGPAAADIEALRAMGASVLIAEADVTREDDVAAVAARISESMPPLRGVVHAAMVLSDGYLSQLTADQMNRVLAPKATGVWNLHRHTLDCELDFFVLFSSVATMFGNPGQANYVAANVFLDAFAHYRRSLGRPAVSIRWGALSEVGYLARHAKLSQFLDQQGLKQFSPDDALRSLSSIIAADVPDVVAARMDWTKWSESYPRSAVSARFSKFLETIASQGTQESFVSVRKSFLQLPPDQRLAFLVDYLAERIAKVLRMPKAKVSVDSPLTDHGLDSLMALELKTRVDRDLEVDVPMTALLQGPTLQQLAERLLRQISTAPADAPAPSAPIADEIGRLVPIQPHGENLPCFGIHPSSGKVGCYTDLSVQLGAAQPFFGIEAGRDGHAGTTTIEQIARAYIGLVRKVQPTGPYCLLGYSMGGAIAYEMAQQMRSEGESIRALVLVDTPSPSLGREADKLDDAQLIAWFVTELGMTLGRRLRASRDEILPLDEAQRISYILDRTTELSIEGKHLSRERVARMLAVFKTNVRAHIEYVPDSYPGEVTFFTADKEAPEYLALHPDAGRLGYGWDRWVDSLTVKRIEGATHHDILSEAHASALAVHLKEMLSGVASS